MRKADDREALLMTALERQQKLTVPQAVALLGVSEATVRRLFVQMEQEHKAIRSYGALQLPLPLAGYSFERLEKMYAEEKQRIGRAAAQLVENGDSIYMDSGTTLLQMAQALNTRIQSGTLDSVFIVTNSYMNIPILSVGCRVLLLGGEYNHERRDFSGAVTEQALERFHFKKCFLGCEGITVRMGLSVDHIDLAHVNEMVLGRSNHKYILADHSKFGREALVSFASLHNIDAILTDALPEESLDSELRSCGVSLMAAE